MNNFVCQKKKNLFRDVYWSHCQLVLQHPYGCMHACWPISSFWKFYRIVWKLLSIADSCRIVIKKSWDDGSMLNLIEDTGMLSQIRCLTLSGRVTGNVIGERLNKYEARPLLSAIETPPFGFSDWFAHRATFWTKPLLANLFKFLW